MPFSFTVKRISTTYFKAAINGKLWMKIPFMLVQYDINAETFSIPLREKYPNTDFFLFQRTRKNTAFGHFSRSVHLSNDYNSKKKFT